MTKVCASCENEKDLSKPFSKMRVKFRVMAEYLPGSKILSPAP